MQPAFWSGKRVFLTGHTGFKGSWMSAWLRLMNARVTGFALAPPTRPNLFDTLRLDENITHVEGDIRDLQAVRRAIEEARPEIVIHMAAQSLVQPSYANPVETYETNVMGTVNLLEAARQVSGVRVVLNVTSDKCYDNKEMIWGYRETDPMGGHDPYSNSKGCAELVTRAYQRSFYCNPGGPFLASARAGNVIGGGDWAEYRLIPDIVRAFGAGRPVLLRNPDAIRPWQHVLESLGGYLLLIEKLWEQGGHLAQGWNFGPDDSQVRSVGWITDAMAARWGDGAAWKRETTELPHEARLLKLDSSKARHYLGWNPQLDIETALDWLVAWYKAFADGRDMMDLTLRQIQVYMARMQGISLSDDERRLRVHEPSAT